MYKPSLVIGAKVKFFLLGLWLKEISNEVLSSNLPSILKNEGQLPMKLKNLPDKVRGGYNIDEDVDFLHQVSQLA